MWTHNSYCIGNSPAYAQMKKTGTLLLCAFCITCPQKNTLLCSHVRGSAHRCINRISVFGVGRIQWMGRGVWQLSTLKNRSIFCRGQKNTKQFGISSQILLVDLGKIISRLSDQIFDAIESPHFHGLWYFYLTLSHSSLQQSMWRSQIPKPCISTALFTPRTAPVHLQQQYQGLLAHSLSLAFHHVS